MPKGIPHTLTQCRRHGLCAHPPYYPHTRVNIDLDPGVRRALQLHAFLHDVPYPRYGERTRNQT